MKCPHCREGIHELFINNSAFTAARCDWFAKYMECPECKKAIIRVVQVLTDITRKEHRTEFPAYPPNNAVRPIAAEVPDPFKQDFIEACNVLPLSAKASAALSRRTLQAILREKAATNKKDLADQIDEVIATGTLPSHIVEGLHAVRNIGNFAAHETKSKTTGAIVDVEVGEAEWNLDVLESLFDFYFIQPALAAKRKADLNKKLKDAGKPLIP